MATHICQMAICVHGNPELPTDGLPNATEDVLRNLTNSKRNPDKLSEIDVNHGDSHYHNCRKPYVISV
jgi:hypothetical protein